MIRIAIGQINPTLGDFSGNCRKIKEYIEKAKGEKVDIIAFPELSICGYPPEDLLFRKRFISDNLKSLQALTKEIFDIIAIVGFVDRKGKDLYNAACVIHASQIKGIYHKIFLPNYGVFDEKRYFKKGKDIPIFRSGNISFSLNICEDIWEKGPTREAMLKGARLIFNCSASVYHSGKIKERMKILSSCAKENALFIVYTNLVGGQDELVFDGQSMVIDPDGKIIGMAKAFKEDMLIMDLDVKGSKGKKGIIIDKEILYPKPPIPKREIEQLGAISEIYQALILGLYDYVKKNDFEKVVIGLSGGIDSSVVAVLAVDALGSDNVIGVFMPSFYSSQESFEDAKQLAENLRIKFINIPISPIFNLYLETLKPHFMGKNEDTTEENLQARIRGNLLMALSNKFGWLVLTTGNKSEITTGYATLYGDMAGGFAVIKDVPKTLVFKIAKYINAKKKIIPERVLIKEPSAELKFHQKDSDLLPKYEILDPIISAYIDENKELEDIVLMGFDKEVVRNVLSMTDKSEYKRRQSPPGIKITPGAFGRRMPITNKYRN